MSTVYYYCPSCDVYECCQVRDVDSVTICPECLGVADVIPNDEVEILESLLGETL